MATSKMYFQNEFLCKRLDDRVIPPIAKLEKLKWINISKGAFTDGGLRSAGKWASKYLKVVNMNDCTFITDIGISVLNECKSIESLALARTNIATLNLEAGIGHWTNLKHLIVSKTNATDVILFALTQAPRIEFFSFNSCANLTKATTIKINQLNRFENAPIYNLLNFVRSGNMEKTALQEYCATFPWRAHEKFVNIKPFRLPTRSPFALETDTVGELFE